ncbi:hypothetical protein K2X33_07205 [bacterium]|nr:hypothetical protein [bacterium]
MRALFAFALVLGFSAPVFADSGSCKLIIQVHFKDGKKKVSVEEVPATSHLDCKFLSQQRQLDSESEDVQNVKVVFGYRELSVLAE